jgi:long-chain acyl-CoA synthetase
MKTHSVVENICVYGDPYRSFIVALVVPSKAHLESIGNDLGKTSPYEILLNDKDVQHFVLKELNSHGLRNRLQKFELPQALTLVQEQWTPESGLITASFKMRRKKIQIFYQRYIDKMYEVEENSKTTCD